MDQKVSWKTAILISIGVFLLSIILASFSPDKNSRLMSIGVSLFISSFLMPFVIRFYPVLGKIKEKGDRWKSYSYIFLLIFVSIVLLLGILNPNSQPANIPKEKTLSQESKQEPFLEILQPHPEIKEWTGSQIVIKGKTDPNTKIKIQNNEVKVDENGIFTYILELSEGKNTIEVVADNGQKQKKITLTITKRRQETVTSKQNVVFPPYVEIFPSISGEANKAFYVEEIPSSEIFPAFLEFLAKNHCPPKNKYPVCAINVYKHPNPDKICLNSNIPWEECEKIMIGHWDNLHSPPKRWFKDPSGKQINF
jgi:hypothetical protein